jgi:hypothetical protein
MTVYGIAANALLHCFLLDKELEGGRAYSAPEKLRKFIHNHVN